MKEGIIYSFELGQNSDFSLFGKREWAEPWARSCSSKTYEKPVTLFLENIDYEVFVDVGAGFGFHSLMNAEKGKEVIAFEAHPIRNGFVRHNLAVYPDIKVYGAVGKVEPANSFQMTQKTGTKNPLKKEDININEILAPYINKKVVVKIDVEGNEVSVLEEMKAFLKLKNFKWLVEFHTKHEPKENVDPFFQDFKETVVMKATEKNPHNFKMFYEKS